MEGKVFSQFHNLVLELCGKRNFLFFFFFFGSINHFNRIMLFGAIDHRLRFDAAGTTAKLSEAVFLSHGWKLGITALTFRNHRFRNLLWHYCPHFTILLPRRSPGPVMGGGLWENPWCHLHPRGSLIAPWLTWEYPQELPPRLGGLWRRVHSPSVQA